MTAPLPARRLGFLLPSVNAVLEPDAIRVLPDAVSAHFTRVRLRHNTEREINEMVRYVPQGAIDLADAGVEAIGFACTAGSLIRGIGTDSAIADLILLETGIPATSTAASVVEALREVEARRIALYAPYEQWLVERERDFLQASGFEVVASRALSLPDPRDCEAVTPERIRRDAREVDVPEADALFVSCADFQSTTALEAIEGDLGKPVITSNQAILWNLLRMIGVEEPVPGYGRLLREDQAIPTPVGEARRR